MKQKNIILILFLLFLVLFACFIGGYKIKIFEGFDMQRCMTVNSIAAETATKAIIASEIIKSLNNHEKLLKVYLNTACEPNEFNIDGTIKPNPNACKMHCTPPDPNGSGTCAYKGKNCIGGTWKAIDSFPIMDRRKPLNYNPILSVGKGIEDLYYSNDEMCERYGHDHPEKCKNVCSNYTEICLISGVKYENCESLNSFVLYKEDAAQLDEPGNEYLKFAYNVIPHIASHDVILKNILDTYSYYDIGVSKIDADISNEGLYNQTVSLAKKPDNRNYNKLASKFHNALSGYTIGNCGSGSADDSVDDNDGYILWILVDWIRYQDHFIQNNIAGNFTGQTFDTIADVQTAVSS